MFITRFVFLLLVAFSTAVYADKSDRYVIAVSSGFSEENQQTYGISSYETLGKGRWGLYGEMLFSYQDDTFQHCGDQCEYIDIDDQQLNFTVGGAYGFTDNFYGLVGGGVRMRSISSSPYKDASVCDPEDEEGGEPVPEPYTNSTQYCSSNTDIGVAAQVGLLYVTPFGLSLSGTFDTEKTATFSLGYQF